MQQLRPLPLTEQLLDDYIVRNQQSLCGACPVLAIAGVCAAVFDDTFAFNSLILTDVCVSTLMPQQQSIAWGLHLHVKMLQGSAHHAYPSSCLWHMSLSTRLLCINSQDFITSISGFAIQ